jgi:UDP-glucose 4-epimerase
MKKALVTGGAGFIGTNLIQRLILEGYQVFSLDNYSTGSKDNELSSVTYVKGDIESIDQFNTQNFDYVFILQLNLEFNLHLIIPKSQLE